jgi:hypothetical protein
MSNPLPYLVRMLLFLAVVAGIGWVLHEDLLRVFNHTPILNTVILGVLVLGIFFVFRQVLILWPEVKWLRRYIHREEGAPPPPAESINLLAPMATMLGERDQIRLSPTATRAVLDGIATRLDERRELARYIIGLLIFLGLLGTFWGLLQTIGAVADAINGLQVSAGDAQQMFAKLKGSIEGPLVGMSTAFGASLFGLSGSLVLGFLELQASQAQGRFHIELEEWLARATSLSSASLPGGPQGIPAYVEALLERNTEGVDGLIRGLQRIEDSRHATAASNATLIERLAALAETTRAQQNLLARFTELSIELRGAISRLTDRATASEADREAMLGHQAAIEGHLGRLLEETVRSRAALAEELRGVAGKLGDRSAAEADRDTVLEQQRGLAAQIDSAMERMRDRSAAEADREAVLAHQRDLAAQVARLAEEAERERARLVEELRNLAARVTDRSAAEADRDALGAHQRNVESQLASLSDETARRHNQLSEELRQAVDRLSDGGKAEADREALVNLQRNVESQLGRLLEEHARDRATLADDLRTAIARLAERFVDVDRDAMAAHQRNIEAHLARLVEDTAQNRIALADELRGEIRLLARTIALKSGIAVSQPSADG